MPHADPTPDASPLLTDLVRRASDGEDLPAAEAEAAFDLFMQGAASPLQMAALLVALRTKGLAASELVGGVRALRRAMVPVPAIEVDTLLDTCGTGGGSVTTFNISTAAALVAAAAGARVAKHGNRSFTSRSGSADVLEALGVRIELTPEVMGRVLGEVGIVFMFAPLLHPAMRHVGPVRRELGIPTIMNILGPLTNPAGARRQVVGVADPRMIGLVVEALRDLGHVRAMVVHGAPGMDELSPAGASRVAELMDGDLREVEVTPQAVGLDPHPLEDLRGGTPEENARLILAVLEGRERAGARAATLLNAGAALHVAGRAATVKEGIRQALEAVDSGAALQKLHELRDASSASAS